MFLPLLLSSLLACHHQSPAELDFSEATANGGVYFGEGFIDQMRGNVSELVSFLDVEHWSPDERCVCRQWSLRRYSLATHVGPDNFGVLVFTPVDNPDFVVLGLDEAYKVVAYDSDRVSNSTYAQLMLAQDALLDCTTTPRLTWVEYRP